MTDRSWLVDESALIRIYHSPGCEQWFERVQPGLVRITTATLLELVYSARSSPAWRALVEDASAGLMPVENLTRRSEQRARAVQGLLAERGEPGDGGR